MDKYERKDARNELRYRREEIEFQRQDGRRDRWNYRISQAIFKNITDRARRSIYLLVHRSLPNDPLGRNNSPPYLDSEDEDTPVMVPRIGSRLHNRRVHRRGE